MADYDYGVSYEYKGSYGQPVVELLESNTQISDTEYDDSNEKAREKEQSVKVRSLFPETWLWNMYLTGYVLNIGMD